MNEQAQASIIAIVSVVLANWVVIYPLISKAVKTAWDKTIEWRDMTVKISELEKRLTKCELDVSAAHDKIRKGKS